MLVLTLARCQFKTRFEFSGRDVFVTLDNDDNVSDRQAHTFKNNCLLNLNLDILMQDFLSKIKQDKRSLLLQTLLDC